MIQQPPVVLTAAPSDPEVWRAVGRVCRSSRGRRIVIPLRSDDWFGRVRAERIARNLITELNGPHHVDKEFA